MNLFGNGDSLGLIRRPVRLISDWLVGRCQPDPSERFLSYWGHDHTRVAGLGVLRLDFAPPSCRSALVLSQDHQPCQI